MRRLEFSHSGILEDMFIRDGERRPPGSSEIEVQVRATGLNFRDVLVALDMYPGLAGPPGLECTGTVVARGVEVTEFEIGDHVLGLSPGGGFSSYVTESADLFVTRPASLSFEEAVTIPVTFLTAYYSLIYLGRLGQTDRLLVHSGAGGVGLAALQVARNVGAEVLATVSTPEKIEYLSAQGVSLIMNSRSYEFVEETKKATGGEGVDLVLNSLARDFIPRSIELLRARGRYLEIGKKDILSFSQVQELNPDISYFLIDLMELAAEKPDLIRAMLSRLMIDFAAGDLTPLPFRSFKFNQDEVVEAFRFMTQGKHIGKIVVQHNVAA